MSGSEVDRLRALVMVPMEHFAGEKVRLTVVLIIRCAISLELFVSERMVMAAENRQPGCKRSRDIAAVVQICALNDDIFVSRL